ncbi:MAG: sigma-70 family RNA polymerase sigma factor [Prevotella sp.]|nr:sigma-70 family RNA polymerase sigma factor [Prevotella sp.]
MNIFGHNSEKSMAEGIRKGDNQAMRDFYAQFGGLLTAACSRYVVNDDDVKDVMQDAMVSIIQNIDSFTYHGKGSLRAWATRIVVNQALNFLKSRKRLQDTFADKDIGNISCADDEPDVGMVPEEVIHDMISRLPEGYRVVFNLYAIEGKSHKEIAEALGIKADSSASQYHRARNMLAREIRKYKQEQT